MFEKSRKFKIKLIFPCWFDIYDPYTFVYPYFYIPYGMSVLAAFLKERGYYIEQCDLAVRFNPYVNSFLPLKFRNKNLDLNKNIEKIYWFLNLSEKDRRFSFFIERILNSISIINFDIIGFSIHSYPHFMFALLLSKKIKQISKAKIVFGGPFITLFSILFPEVLDIIDYFIIGDGRLPLLKLMDCLNNKLSLNDVPNLIYKKGGRLIASPNYNYPIEDIPLPDFKGLFSESYKDKKFQRIILPYQISRGCSSGCNFCIINNMYNKIEFKSYEKIIYELKVLQESYNINIFDFVDEAINISYDFLEKLCNLFLENRLNMKWKAYAKVTNLNKNILKLMKKSGCYGLIFGIESGSDRILRSMNKGFTSKEANQILKDSTEVGLFNSVCLIAGYPYETEDDIKQSIEFIKENKKYIHSIQIFRFELVYNSLLYLNPTKYGITNLCAMHNFRYIFSFDEINGLKWEQKNKQQEHSLKLIWQAATTNVKSRPFIN